MDITPCLISRKHEFPVFSILAVILGIDGEIESDLDVVDNVEV